MLYAGDEEEEDDEECKKMCSKMRRVNCKSNLSTFLLMELML